MDTLSFAKLHGPGGELYAIRLMSSDQPKPILTVMLAYDLQVRCARRPPRLGPS